jgi:hypothetical protein
MRKAFAYINGSMCYQKLFSSVSNTKQEMSKKVFILLALAVCSAYASSSDWVIINNAISKPADADPEALKNAILNIIGDFIPTPAPTVPPTPSTCATCPTQAATTGKKIVIL